jgi:3-carboxy-cis,cis-muconate cycloisomerase
VGRVAQQLELADPELPWHTVRTRPARLAGALGSALGTMAKIARDLALLAQTEVAEAQERAGAGRGGSSTMPHKQNPVGAVAVLACAGRGPALVSAVLAAMAQEHERAAGAWQSEWGALLELLGLAGSAATSLREALRMLEVDASRMRANIDPLVMTESVVTALGGGAAAQSLVADAALRSVEEDRPLREVLSERPEIRDALGETGLDRALDPAQYLGASDELIDRALRAHRGAPER